MKQVFLSGKGQVELTDVPVPSRRGGSVLVRNAFSLISAGTEGAAITRSDGVRGLYEKVNQSRDKFGQVWQMAQSQGISSTTALVQNKLSDSTPIGYSAAGVVLEIDSEDVGFDVGDRVACMGTGHANHAEFITAPKNLTVRLPASVPFESASFGAIACIAMQGIRRLELAPGERVGIVGLGLIGQICFRLATAMGYRAYGFDIDDERVRMAMQASPSQTVLNSASSDPVAYAKDMTEGHGMDGVVICASSKSGGIVNQAFEMCRTRGRVSIVGDVGLDLKRAQMYAKELEVRMSCSYGVGRYDASYELGGLDYPFSHVRWTERRNLEYFISLLDSGQLDLTDLITNKIVIDDASKAYALIKSSRTDVYGVLLDYKLPETPKLPENAYVVDVTARAEKTGSLGIGVIGVGMYAKNIHMPNLKKLRDVDLRVVASQSGGSAGVIARRFEVAKATSDTAEVFADSGVNAVVIATRHSSHSRLVLDALGADKHTFVEKPMATSVADCLRIVKIQRSAGLVVRVGFNRRFSPMLRQMKKAVGEGRKLFNIRVNVGAIGQHWSNTAEEGGRLMGEGVHFFDLANWMTDSVPVSVTAQFLGEPDALNPDVSLTIRYENGSIANISYVTVGHTGRGKEFYELFGNARSAMVDDYRTCKVFGAPAANKLRRLGRDKGQFGAMQEFVNAARTGVSDGGADAVAGLWATAIAEAVVQSAKQGKAVNMADFIDASAKADTN